MNDEVINLRLGMTIYGKWQQKAYKIIRCLGTGTVGTVYLCSCNGRFVALKLSKQTMSLMREVNILKGLNKVQAIGLVPYLYEVDDYVVSQQEQYAFYSMEYIQGKSVETYLKRNGAAGLSSFLLQLLAQLEALHQLGYVFGDLKNDNLLIAQKGAAVRLLDVGGITKQGYAVKEYSALYDRAPWQAGSRKAEPSYDLFAIVLIVFTTYYPDQAVQRTCKTITDIYNKLSLLPLLTKYLAVFQKSLTSKYQTATEMRTEILTILIKQRDGKRSQRRLRKQKRREIAILTSFSLFYILIRYIT